MSNLGRFNLCKTRNYIIASNKTVHSKILLNLMAQLGQESSIPKVERKFMCRPIEAISFTFT